MANKITKREVINSMLANEMVSANATWVAYLENELSLLDRKVTNKKATKTQEANMGIKSIILAVLEGAEPMTITEIQGASADLSAYSNQKITALVKQLVDCGLVVKTMDKKVSRFGLVDGD